MKSSKATPPDLCPCESSKPYSACCEPYHLGSLGSGNLGNGNLGNGKIAATAEALMRSRYTAYVLGLEDYVLQTWHPNTRPLTIDLNNDVPIKWLGLQIKRVESLSPTTATVEFVARYKVNGKAERMHEISQFELVETRWYYLTGEVL